MMHRSGGHRSTETLARVGTFFVATRADWQAWLDDAGTDEQETVLVVTRKPVGREWSGRRARLSGRVD